MFFMENKRDEIFLWKILLYSCICEFGVLDRRGGFYFLVYKYLLKL